MFQITAIFEDTQPMAPLREAFDAISPEVPGVSLTLFGTGALDRDEDLTAQCLETVAKSDFLLLIFHGSMSYFHKYLRLRPCFEGTKPYFFHSSIESELEEMTKNCQLPARDVQQLQRYLEAGGQKNRENFLRYLIRCAAGIDCPCEPVELPQWDGFYGKPEGVSDGDWLRQIKGSGKPVIAVLLHLATVQSGDTAFADQLMTVIRQADCTPLVLYSNMMPSSDGQIGGLRQALRTYCMLDGQPVPGAMIVAAGFSLSLLSAPGKGTEQVTDSVFEILGIPAIHGLHTNFTRAQWEASIRGMDPIYLSNIYSAEFDGQLIGVPMTCTEQVVTSGGPMDRTVLLPERAEKLVHLARNWAVLRQIPWKDKKIAIILHNQPPRADMIGCAYGLDTPETVFRMLRAMEQRGFRLDYPFTGGKDILDRFLSGLTNDGSFRSPEDLLARAEAALGPEVWRPWFASLPQSVREAMEHCWGKAPGELMAVDQQILVPCIQNGNLLLGLQPPRAMEDKAEEAYHDTDLVCSWQYVAFYRYVEQCFGADAIVHVGTHGTLEWLPGKEIGLSQSCYPDLVLGTLPNLYPYIIDVPGEGAQAKRRSGACLIDHLIPSMTESGTSGELAVLDDLLGRYYHARTNGADPGPVREQVRDLAQKLQLDRELHLSPADFEEQFEPTAQRLHLWISDIKSTEIRDGLHIFGQPPKDERLRNLLRLLVRVPNGTVPSLRQGLCRALDRDPDALCPEDRAVLLEEADELGRQLFLKWESLGYGTETIGSALAAFPQLQPDKTGPLRRCLTFVQEQVLPRLLATTDEMDSFLAALEGRFVRKGPSGSPSRGNARLLPTGRNFYTIDPAEIPCRSAWETGRQLADDLLQTHIRETGSLPEHIAIVVYAGDAVKTGGDDVAEVLWLYGVRPVWLGDTDRVIGLEVLPPENLGRPRIDVTLRISGLFRDTFPNLIELVDEAVNLVATLDETHEQNFVKKHVDRDMEDFLQEGIDREHAYEQASLRIFGCPPGTYGAGVDALINSRQWKTGADLGTAYITWSGHGYSRSRHGDQMQALFARRLSGCDATVKNISSCEEDMLSDDDYYIYHGGLISAVTAQQGKAPVSYSTGAADPSRISTKTIQEDTAKLMRARITNPKWIAGLQKHSFRGAQEFSAMVDILFGWDASAGVLEDYMYDDVFDTYLGDPALRDWIREQNPYALHAMSERLLEAVQRGLWDADERRLENLQAIYLETEGSLEGE